ncbi:hypothetical protein [Fluviicola taffensis]|uniref:hypothetical protein n=1 Tax=Fluviicola taffensis TaxID=191579 RepID=UPI0031383F1B
MKKLTFLFILLAAISVGCKKKGCTDSTATNYNDKATSDDGSCTYTSETETGPYLVVKLHFDSLAPRLDNFGNPAVIPSDHSAQSPIFHGMSAHYIEFAQSMYTQLGAGEILYHGAETTAGGSNAVNFNKAIIKGDNEVFVKIPLKNISPDTYNWVRMSLTYQNYDLDYRYNGADYTGRLASFVGFNTYISTYKIWNQTLTINANKLQGYWGFENLGIVVEGQAPGTTVPNPLSATSPVPAGSCVVTGSFDTPFTITGNETQDINCTMNLSTNKSFEWYDANQDGKYEPGAGDYPTDMGLRGLKPVIVP